MHDRSWDRLFRGLISSALVIMASGIFMLAGFGVAFLIESGGCVCP